MYNFLVLCPICVPQSTKFGKIQHSFEIQNIIHSIDTYYCIILREVQSYIGNCVYLLAVESDKNENANSQNLVKQVKVKVNVDLYSASS